MFVALDTNIIQAYSFPDGAPDGVITRFMAPVNHMEFNVNGSILVAGASDFNIKVVKLDDSSYKLLQGHEAPILSVAVDPKEEYVLSSSCDGTVKIWKLLEKLCIKTWPILPKCNDVSLSKTLARLCWNPDGGKIFVIPVDKEIRIYERGSWNQIGTLKSDDVLQTVSICLFSSCGRYLVSSCTDGLIIIWDFQSQKIIDSFKHAKGYTICGLAWNPSKKNEVAYTDVQGQLGLLEWTVPAKVNNNKVTLDNYTTLFDDSDDDFPIATDKPAIQTNSQDEDELPLIEPRKKFRSLDDDEENSKEFNEEIASDKKNELNNDSILDTEKSLIPKCSGYHGPKLTPLQESFQIGSTPKHLSQRFMVWNSVGIIRAYNTDEENSIDVEFHDTSVHHSMHFENPLDHSMADLSHEAILLACEADVDAPSKLVCMHFGLWDNSKEWTVDLPTGEVIQAICIGDGWVAAVTDMRNVRLFTIGGLQREIFTLPGPVVSVAAKKNQLLIVYHLGTGVPGEQYLGYSLYTIAYNGCKQKISSNLSISPKSLLSWIGFTLEGTPAAVDSSGSVRILNCKAGNLWTPIANLKEHTKGKSDNYWVVGISETNQQIRCIRCKGSRYPPVLPRPVVSVLSFQMPLCDLTNEKGQLEENFWKSKIIFGVLNSHKDDIDLASQDEIFKQQSELLMKLFALACKTDRDCRAIEIARLMPTQHALQLTIKYATILKRIPLAERLGDMARQRLKEELENNEREEEKEEEKDFRTELDAGYNRTKTQWSRHSKHLISKKQSNKPPASDEEEYEETEEVEENNEEENDSNYNNSELTENGQNERVNIFSAPHTKYVSLIENSPKNPFKISSNQSESFGRATAIFDNFKKQTSKSVPMVIPGNKSKVQKKLSGLFNDNSSESPSSVKQKFGFDLWLESNKERLKEENADSSEEDILKCALLQFRLLPAEEKKEWNEKAKSSTVKAVTKPKMCKSESTDNQKRPAKEGKQPEEKKKNNAKRLKTQSRNFGAKLSLFAFTKKEG